MKIEAAGIEKWYFRGGKGSNRFFAVQQTDLILEPGQVTVLTGRSGSGKTTLMHMMAGLLTPDGGKVFADGQELYGKDDTSLSRFRNQHFGLIPQGADVLPELTVMENILLARGMFRNQKDRTYEEIKGHAEKLLEEMNILPLADVRAKELSGGERRRVCAARALAGIPEVIFADEPTSDLDNDSMHTVFAMLREAADAGAAVMIVTHDIEALDYADVKIHMDGGRRTPAFTPEK